MYYTINIIISITAEDPTKAAPLAEVMQVLFRLLSFLFLFELYLVFFFSFLF